MRKGQVAFTFVGQAGPYVWARWTKPKLIGQIWEVISRKSVRDHCPKWRKGQWVLELTLSADGKRLEGRWLQYNVADKGPNPSGKPCHVIYRRWVSVTLTRAVPANGRLRVAAAAHSSALVPAQIALLLDASGSMRQRLPNGTTKIAAAKQVMRAVIANLPATALVGLRVYGHRYRSRPKRRSCTDSELLVPFGRDNHARLIGAIDKLRPRGQTPIGLSLARTRGRFRRCQGLQARRPGQRRHRDLRAACQGPVLSRRRDPTAARRGLKFASMWSGSTSARVRRAPSSNRSQTKPAAAISAPRTPASSKRRSSGRSTLFVVRTPTGKTIAKGTVGGPAVTVPVGKYQVSISGAVTLTADNVVVSNDKEALLTVTRVNGQVQIQRSVH